MFGARSIKNSNFFEGKYLIKNFSLGAPYCSHDKPCQPLLWLTEWPPSCFLHVFYRRYGLQNGRHLVFWELPGMSGILPGITWNSIVLGQ